MENEDYTPVKGTLTFAEDEHMKRIDIPIRDDIKYEGPENFRFALTNPTGGATLWNLIETDVFIYSDDPRHQFRFEDAAYYAIEEEGKALIKVRRSGDVSIPATIDYELIPGTAESSDYTSATTGSITFGAGEIAKILVIPITDDTLKEYQESFQIRLLDNNPDDIIIGLGTWPTTEVVIYDKDHLKPGSYL
ncbi:Calx-beta domain-containing protein [Paenibacillus solisilvae]|uniref:Calx-beta domain-containing protein n=1 Tax=Paenibacillus solisilvae TaxID=2486751 RepID=A0ABW0VZ02_9BACL